MFHKVVWQHTLGVVEFLVGLTIYCKLTTELAEK